MNLKLDRVKFWKLYKSSGVFGATTQATADALNTILDKLETESRLLYISWYSYALATAFHESGLKGNHFIPVKEGKGKTTSKLWKEKQSKYWNTGYYGRGLIQTTWKENYLKIGKRLGVGDLFVKQPNKLLEVGWAYEALIIGMVDGIYRKDTKGPKNLARYLKKDDESTANYIKARDIVNGDIAKNGAMIAGYAGKFESILTATRIV